ncbi:hypothetical protein [Ktedonobacter robiniae]|uniref:Uncharacterized protein n=1 Tax=Ktedonobacter robiniae TaxID=2778365 RepID=A0ABQ3US50_9CHLR|nr:hypothetical protein [Ktedonobacter robiniae]GHO55611.1 hypothetical protein KSB_40860 [Ktedonobacter robiniae]
MGKEEKTHGVSCGRPSGEAAHLIGEINGAQPAPFAVVRVLWLYLVLPPECVRVFTSSSRADLDEQVKRGNTDLCASSLTASQFLQKMGFPSLAGERDGSTGENAKNQGTTVKEKGMRNPITTKAAEGNE